MMRRFGRLLAAALIGVGGVAFSARAGGSDELLADGIARFYFEGQNAGSSAPSLALAKPRLGQGPVPGTWAVTPRLTKEGDGYRAFIPIDAGTSLYGTGEIAGPLLRNGRVSTCWNTDAYAYTEKSPSLYQSHPWVLAVRPDGTAFGVLADTTWRCEIDLTSGIQFTGAGAPFPVIVIDRASPEDVMKGLADLVGTIPLPPLWSLGYHQCRYSYNPEARVREIAHEFRSRKLPCDVIWFDIDYMNGYRVFTFDASQFPDPTRLNADLEKDGFRCIWMIDPGVKQEKGYSIFESGTSAGVWVKNAAGATYVGDVWPGKCVFPDYTRPEVRDWWSALYKDFMATGIDGVWNDMNEPAIFNVASKTMPEDNVHGGGQLADCGILRPGAHLQYHNVYGMLMARATRDGILAANPAKRPFVLTRAGYLGSHRYAATWTGDNSAEWDDLEHSISMALNLSLSAQPFCGPDIGGFNANGDGKLFARWLGMGSLFPFARGHTAKGNINKEPWAFDAEVEATCRLALERRYRFMPYLYTLFAESSASGLPVMRPLFFADPKDPALRSEDDAFLLGRDVLVVAKTTPLGDRAISLPKGTWRAFDVIDAKNNADLPELKLRAGAIVPAGPVMQYTSEKPLDPLTLIVSLDDKDTATGVLYEDAGDGWDYQKGDFLRTTYRARKQGNELVVEPLETKGSRPRPKRTVNIEWLTDTGVVRGSGPDGGKITLPAPK